MDRFDCQFLMGLATFIHLKTFVLGAGVAAVNSSTLRGVMAAAALLGPAEKEELVAALLGRA